jgi:MYXO-CTERM domain-containing protein
MIRLQTVRIALFTAFLALTLPGAVAQANQPGPDSAEEVGPVGAPLLVDTSLPCPGPECGVTPASPVEHAQGLRTVYLNFEGVTLTSSNNSEDATTNTSFIISQKVNPGNSLTIPPFNANDLYSTQGLSRAQIIQYTVQQMYESHQDFNIEFVTTRPTSGNYHMVVFGSSCFGVTGQSGCGGIAHLDCGDFVPSNIVFVFPQTGQGLRVADLAATASQELAHSFGLSHTDDLSDIMYPSIRQFIPTEYGAGNIPPQDQQGACNGASYQDSYDKMLSTIGFRGQDTLPPVVKITEPSNNDVVKVGDMVKADVEDDGTITGVRLLINNAEVASKTSGPWSFAIPAGTQLGRVFVEVEATDDSGNSAGNRVSVLLGNGDEAPCDDGKCENGYDCVEGLCYSADGGSIGELGDDCTGNGQCYSGLCAQSGEEQRCSQTCDETNVCPDGFHCIGNTACWPDEPAEQEESGICSVSNSSSGALATFGLFVLALLVSRRRRG